MAESRVVINRPQSASTPPHCAICLGNCMDKCFADSCVHQFCFQCLLQWSKVKAECPLCKQPFKSIIHNVISNEEYDTHVVEPPRNEVPMLHRLREDYWFLPLPRAQRQQFHVRTTFTVDSTGEHAIQQMLLSSPFAGGTITVDAGLPDLGNMEQARTVYPRHRRDYSATSFRRSIYAQNLWVVHDDHLLGMRYRDCTPSYFRTNPAARHRLVPWLNRELNALLYEDTRLIMQVVDLILDNLANHHICGRTFRNLLREYFQVKTDHFIHEFYNFMRSPYDMIGYDRNITYTNRTASSPVPVIEETVEIPDDNSNDSDVVLVENSTEPVTIDLLDSNSDSDEPVVVSSGFVCPMPFVEPHQCEHVLLSPSSPSPSPPPFVNLPPKLRFKQQLSADENRKRKQTRPHKRPHRTRSSSPPSDSSSSSSEDYNRKFIHSYKKYKKRKMLKKLIEQQNKHSGAGCSSSSVSGAAVAGVQITSDSDDEKPLINLLNNSKNKKKKSKKKTRHQEGNDQLYPMDLSKPSCSSFSSTITSNHGAYESNCTTTLSLSCNLTDNASEPSTSSRFKVKFSRNDRRNSNTTNINEDGGNSGSGASTDPYELPHIKSEIRPVQYDGAEPSTSSKPLPLVLRRNRDKWYIFDESDSD